MPVNGFVHVLLRLGKSMIQNAKSALAHLDLLVSSVVVACHELRPLKFFATECFQVRPVLRTLRASDRWQVGAGQQEEKGVCICCSGHMHLYLHQRPRQ